jgi:hypothetical protein
LTPEDDSHAHKALSHGILRLLRQLTPTETRWNDEAASSYVLGEQRDLPLAVLRERTNGTEPREQVPSGGSTIRST